MSQSHSDLEKWISCIKHSHATALAVSVAHGWDKGDCRVTQKQGEVLPKLSVVHLQLPKLVSTLTQTKSARRKQDAGRSRTIRESHMNSIFVLHLRRCEGGDLNKQTIWCGSVSARYLPEDGEDSAQLFVRLCHDAVTQCGAGTF